jgi:hypothetical protein
VVYNNLFLQKPNLRSKIAFNLFISLMAKSLLGPVTMHICALAKWPSLVHSQATILNINSANKVFQSWVEKKSVIKVHTQTAD